MKEMPKFVRDEMEYEKNRQIEEAKAATTTAVAA